MKNFNELLNKLNNDGHNTNDIMNIVNDFKAASFEETDYYMNQLFGILVGLNALGYITADELNAINQSIEEDGIQ